MRLVDKRALRIANAGGIVHLHGYEYNVPSESQPGTCHRVNVKRGTCPCAYSDGPCKHVKAARIAHYLRTRETMGDRGEKKKRKFPNKPWYDFAASREYRSVRELLRCLGATFEYRPPKGRQRPPVCYGDLLVVAGLAKYADESTRFAVPDPTMLVRGGYLQSPRIPKPSTVRDHMRTPQMGRMLRVAFDTIVDCFISLRNEYVLDTSWFGTPNSEILIEQRSGADKIITRMRNAKISMAAQLGTLAVLGFVVADENDSDMGLFLPTLEQFWDRFQIDKIYADSGFSKPEHYEAIAARGGVAMIDFKDAPLGRERRPQGFPHFDEQLEWWQRNQTDFLANYHQRNLSETINEVFKGTIARRLRSRLEECMVNEAALFFIIYNLIRLQHARYEYGIAIPFADDRALRIIDGIDEEPDLTA